MHNAVILHQFSVDIETHDEAPAAGDHDDGGGGPGPGHLQLPRRLGQAGGQRGLQVSCDWWKAGHVTTIAASDWSRCFLLSGSEAVTKADAEVLCAFHNGAWVAEIDRPGENADR